MVTCTTTTTMPVSWSGLCSVLTALAACYLAVMLLFWSLVDAASRMKDQSWYTQVMRVQMCWTPVSIPRRSSSQSLASSPGPPGRRTGWWLDLVTGANTRPCQSSGATPALHLTSIC